MGKGSKGNDHTGELGENITATVVLNQVKHMAGVLLKKHCKIFYHTYSKKTSGQRQSGLVGDFVGLMEPTTSIFFANCARKNLPITGALSASATTSMPNMLQLAQTTLLVRADSVIIN